MLGYLLKMNKAFLYVVGARRWDNKGLHLLDRLIACCNPIGAWNKTLNWLTNIKMERCINYRLKPGDKAHIILTTVVVNE